MGSANAAVELTASSRAAPAKGPQRARIDRHKHTRKVTASDVQVREAIVVGIAGKVVLDR